MNDETRGAEYHKLKVAKLEPALAAGDGHAHLAECPEHHLSAPVVWRGCLDYCAALDLPKIAGSSDAC